MESIRKINQAIYSVINDEGFELHRTEKRPQEKMFCLIYKNQKDKRVLFLVGDYIFSSDLQNEPKLLYERTEYSAPAIECPSGQCTCPPRPVIVPSHDGSSFDRESGTKIQ
jgi:hypothetical protein